MSSEGWIKIYRKIIDSRVFANPELLKLWMLCLLKANHQTNWVHVDGVSDPVKVEPGQFITGRYSLQRDYYTRRTSDMKSARTLWRWLQKLEKWGNLSIKPSNKYSLVGINNWDKYQNIDFMSNGVSIKCPTDVQQVSTNKNENNEEKYKCGDSDRWDGDQPIDYYSFVETFNELYNRELRVTDKKREMIRGRLRTFTGAEIKQAWENRLNNDWLNGEGKKYLGDWQAAMRNDEKVDKYLNGQPQSEHELLDTNPLRRAANGN